VEVETDVIQMGIADADTGLHEDPFINVFNIVAWRKSVNNQLPDVYRSLDDFKLNQDTLEYHTDFTLWDNPDSLILSDLNYRFGFKVALCDLDTGQIDIQYNLENNLILAIHTIDTNQILWSKDFNENGSWNRLWEVKSSSLPIFIPTNLSLIKDNFIEYNMYSSIERKQVDYCKLIADSVSSQELAQILTKEFKLLLTRVTDAQP
jgi:hypothetical protein